MTPLFAYLSLLSEQGGQAWNRFWFTPVSPRPLAYLRMGTGVLACIYFLSWTNSLHRWFGTDGLLPAETVKSFLADNNGQHFHFSPLFAFDATGLWCFHGLAIFSAVLLTIGMFSRVTAALTLLALLSYIHRAPMLVGPFESVLVMLLCYLPLGPCGAIYSCDAWRLGPSQTPHWTANLSLRLIQLHTAGFILLVAVSACASNVWMNGTALWVLEAQTSTRPLNLSWIRNYPFLVNAWTHSFVLINFLFPVLVWNRLLRPLLIVLFAVLWLSIIPFSGQLYYVLAILLAISSFWDFEPSRDLCSNAPLPSRG